MSITNARSIIENSRISSGRSLTLLRYPDDIDSVPHKFILAIKKRSTKIEMNSGVLSGSETRNLQSSITLPIPQKIMEPISVSYKQEALNIMGELIRRNITNISQGNIDISQTALDAFNATLVGGIGTISSIAAGLASRFGDARERRLRRISPGSIGARAAASAIPGIVKGIGVGFGILQNPFNTAILTGVNLRSFDFQWLISPENKRESKSIEDIIKIIRYAMLPRTSLSGFLMHYPSEVDWKILGSTKEFDFPTKPCVIENFIVDRSPGAHGPAFFAETGAPVLYRLHLKLLEVQPILRDDLENTLNMPSDIQRNVEGT